MYFEEEGKWGFEEKSQREKYFFSWKKLLAVYLIAKLTNYVISLLFLEQKFSILFKAEHFTLDKVESNCLLSVLSLLYYPSQCSLKGHIV